MRPSSDGSRIGEEFFAYIGLQRPVKDRLQAFRSSRELPNWTETVRELLEIAEGRIPVIVPSADPEVPLPVHRNGFVRCGAAEPHGTRGCRRKEGHEGDHATFSSRGPARPVAWPPRGP